MATVQNIFTGNTNPAIETQSIIFTGASAVYLVYTGGSGLGYEIDAYLQIFVEPGEQRNIMWIIERDNLTTANILPIPSEYMGFPMQVVLFASEAISIRMEVLLSDCSCQTGLDSIDTKVNILLAKGALDTATRIAGLLIGGVASEILPALAGGVLREAIKIFNPSTEAILIGFDRIPTPLDFDDIIAPLSFFDEDKPFRGALNAITQSGNSATIDITTLP